MANTTKSKTTSSAKNTKEISKKAAALDAATSGKSVKLSVRSMSGADMGHVEAAGAVFSAEIIPHLVHATVVWQQSKSRSGTHQALTRSMKKGGKKKPYKQKHTGRARAGSSISPLWVGGASIHGPLPRSYETRLPKRTRRQAMASVLTDRAQNNAVVVLDSLDLKMVKTKAVADSFKSLGLQGKKILLVCQESEMPFATAARNISDVSILNAEGLNVYDVLRNDVLVCSKSTVELIGSENA